MHPSLWTAWFTTAEVKTLEFDSLTFEAKPVDFTLEPRAEPSDGPTCYPLPVTASWPTWVTWVLYQGVKMSIVNFSKQPRPVEHNSCDQGHQMPPRDVSSSQNVCQISMDLCRLCQESLGAPWCPQNDEGFPLSQGDSSLISWLANLHESRQVQVFLGGFRLCNHHPFKEGGRSKCKFAIRRCFGGDLSKCMLAFFFHRLYCKLAFW